MLRNQVKPENFKDVCTIVTDDIKANRLNIGWNGIVPKPIRTSLHEVKRLMRVCEEILER
jgi:hypothetical protein